MRSNTEIFSYFLFLTVDVHFVWHLSSSNRNRACL